MDKKILILLIPLLMTIANAGITILPVVSFNSVSNVLTVSYIVSGAPVNSIQLNAGQSANIILRTFTLPVNSFVVNGSASSPSIFNTLVFTASNVPTVTLIVNETPTFNGLNGTVTNALYPSITAVFSIAPIPKINANILLNCTAAPYVNIPYNLIVARSGCAINQNLTFIPNSTVQTHINAAVNQIITVKPIPKWNLVFNCTSGFNGASNTISNSTVNALLKCNPEPKLGLTVNVTPSNTETINAIVFNKTVRIHGTSINNTQYGIRVNAFYPIRNINITLDPGSCYREGSSDTSICALNLTNINLTQANKAYQNKYGKSCFNPININGTFLCLQQTANSFNLESICQEQFLLDRNISEGLAKCVINDWANFQSQSHSQSPYLSTHIYPDNIIKTQNDTITDLRRTPAWVGLIVWAIVPIAVVLMIVYAYLSRTNKSIQRK